MKIRYKIRDGCKELMDDLFSEVERHSFLKAAWRYLSLNEHPYAIEILEKNQDLIYWEYLSKNKNAIHLLKQNLDKIHWPDLCHDNENCLQIIEDMTVEELNAKFNPYWESQFSLFDFLHHNPGAVKFLEKHIDKINWDLLSSKYNAIHLIQANMDKVNWNGLSENKNAIELLLQNPAKIEWRLLAKNENALHILKQHPEKIDYDFLIKNKSKEALDMYIDHFSHLSLNSHISLFISLLQHPCIFEIEYDLDAIQQKMQDSGLAEEIISTALHPNKVKKWVEQGFDDF